MNAYVTNSPIEFLCEIVNRTDMNSNLKYKLMSSMRVFATALRNVNRSNLEQYFVEGTLLGCFDEHVGDGFYNLLVKLIANYDRRRPELTLPSIHGKLTVSGTHVENLVRVLESQQIAIFFYAMQTINECGFGRSKTKVNLIIVLSRELSGRTILAEPTMRERAHLEDTVHS